RIGSDGGLGRSSLRSLYLGSWRADGGGGRDLGLPGDGTIVRSPPSPRRLAPSRRSGIATLGPHVLLPRRDRRDRGGPLPLRPPVRRDPPHPAPRRPRCRPTHRPPLVGRRPDG